MSPRATSSAFSTRWSGFRFATICCRANRRFCICISGQKAFELMKQLGVIQLETEGKNAGCWVMPFESHTGNEEHEADKILVRSNGTVTYTGKDIAYQMWKLGVLGLDFNYKLFHTYADGKEVWITTAEETDDATVPEIRRRRNGLQRDRLAPILPAGSRQKRRRGDFARKRRSARAFISLMKWSRFRRRRRKNSAFSFPKKTSKNLLSKCPDAKVWASKPTI